MQQFEEQDYNKKFDFSTWKKIIKFCAKYKRNFVWLFLSSIFLAVTAALIPLMTGYAIDTFVEAGNLDGLFGFAVLFTILILANGLTVLGFIYVAGRIEVDVAADVREAGFHQIQRLSFSYFDTTPTGWIMSRLTSDTFSIGHIISFGTVDVIHGIFTLLAYYIFMFIIDVRLALIMVAAMPIMLVLSIIFQRKILKAHRESRKQNSKITGAYNEGITGAKTTKTLMRERRNFQDFDVLTGRMRRASVRASTISAIYFPVLLVITAISVALVLGEGSTMVAAGVITVGMFFTFMRYASEMFEPISQIGQILSEMQSAQASAERAISLIEATPDIVDSPEVIAKYGDFKNPKPETWKKIKGDITFKNVSFKYKVGEPVLENFNLHVKAGEKIALVGETGSGKSTIVNLSCRFYEPTEGQVLIDGMDYREHPQIWLQSNLGYVLQTPHLFSGSIRENIRYGNLEATDEEIIEACKTVDVWDFIQTLEDGLDTDVGEGGSRLSTGEKQLISFARAIIKNPAFFVLDEATSSIDTQTEQKIQSAIYKVLEGRTSFIVAHRLSTIRHADRILVIDKGKILEQGTHKELLAQKGHYHTLYTNQFKKEQEETVLAGEIK